MMYRVLDASAGTSHSSFNITMSLHGTPLDGKHPSWKLQDFNSSA
jgi:hypothetical protein